LPTELLWAIIIALAITVVAEWPFGYPFVATEFQLFGVRLGELLLVVVTWMLWYATRRLVKGADRTAERQLRAYIYIEKVRFKLTGDLCNIKYRIKNFGQTPAYNVRVLSAAAVVDWNNGVPQIPIPNEVETLGSMAPREDFFWLEQKADIAADRASIEGGTRAIFLVGTIVYEVAFEIRARETNFSYYIGGDAGTNGKQMLASSIGNDAT
jgi:hypothetical protein